MVLDNKYILIQSGDGLPTQQTWYIDLALFHGWSTNVMPAQH